MLDWQKKKHFGLDTKKDYPFRELVDWYLRLPGTLKLRTSTKIIQHCNTLEAHFGNTLAREIKPHMIEAFQQRGCPKELTGGTPLKPSSVNREFEVMKRIFNLALREELVDKNPCFRVSKLPEENARDRVLCYAEFSRLTEALPLHAADIVRMGYYTGMRFGEIVGLTWDRVNLNEGYVRLTSEVTKTGKPRRVYLVPQAIDVVERAKKVRSLSHNHVFTYKGMSIKSIKTALKTALKKTGIRNFTFHDLLRTFNTNMQKAGIKDTVTMRMTGHRTLSMFVRYSTVEHEDARNAVEKFSEFLDRESKITSISTSQEKQGQATEPNPSKSLTPRRG